VGQEQGPEFYNTHLKKVSLPLEKSPWLDVYEVVLSLLPADDVPIADLGCGTGRFAKLLARRGYTKYLGIDFAEKRVEAARAYVPQFQFVVGDVLDPAVKSSLQGYRVFVLTEVLEHLQGDLELLESLPGGSCIVLSVPNYDSAGHVRRFESPETVINRYSGLLDFSRRPSLVLTRPVRPERKIFVHSARRRDTPHV